MKLKAKLTEGEHTCPAGIMEALGLMIRSKHKRREKEKEKVSNSGDTGHVKFKIFLV